MALPLCLNMCLANPALETGLESQLWLGETPADKAEGVSSEGGPSLVLRAPGRRAHHAGVVGLDVLGAVAQRQTWQHRHGVNLAALQPCSCWLCSEWQVGRVESAELTCSGLRSRECLSAAWAALPQGSYVYCLDSWSPFGSPACAMGYLPSENQPAMGKQAIP